MKTTINQHITIRLNFAKKNPQTSCGFISSNQFEYVNTPALKPERVPDT